MISNLGHHTHTHIQNPVCVSVVKVCDFYLRRQALRSCRRKFLVTCNNWTWLRILCFMCFCQFWFTVMNVWHSSHLCVTV